MNDKSAGVSAPLKGGSAKNQSAVKNKENSKQNTYNLIEQAIWSVAKQCGVSEDTFQQMKYQCEGIHLTPKTSNVVGISLCVLTTVIGIAFCCCTFSLPLLICGGLMCAGGFIGSIVIGIKLHVENKLWHEILKQVLWQCCAQYVSVHTDLEKVTSIFPVDIRETNVMPLLRLSRLLNCAIGHPYIDIPNKKYRKKESKAMKVWDCLCCLQNADGQKIVQEKEEVIETAIANVKLDIVYDHCEWDPVSEPDGPMLKTGWSAFLKLFVMSLRSMKNIDSNHVQQTALYKRGYVLKRKVDDKFTFAFSKRIFGMNEKDFIELFKDFAINVSGIFWAIHRYKDQDYFQKALDWLVDKCDLKEYKMPMSRL